MLQVEIDNLTYEQVKAEGSYTLDFSVSQREVKSNRSKPSYESYTIKLKEGTFQLLFDKARRLDDMENTLLHCQRVINELPDLFKPDFSDLIEIQKRIDLLESQIAG
jgi:hypothetical protein